VPCAEGRDQQGREQSHGRWSETCTTHGTAHSFAGYRVARGGVNEFLFCLVMIEYY
jgi:hypothetical protein